MFMNGECFIPRVHIFLYKQSSEIYWYELIIRKWSESCMFYYVDISYPQTLYLMRVIFIFCTGPDLYGYMVSSIRPEVDMK